VKPPQHFRLDEVCNIEYGTRVTRKRDGGSGYPVYGGGGATFEMDTFNREDRLVIARFGMSEQCTRVVDGKFFLNDSGITLSPKKGAMVQRFLDYQILRLNNQIYALGKGTAQKNLDAGGFRDLPLYVPSSYEEQHRIVALLDEAFEALATAKANAEQNLRNALVFFESHLEAVFSQKEEGWTQKRLAEFADFKNGLNFSRNSSGQTLRMVGVGDFQERSIVPLDKLQCTTIDGNVTEDYLIREGDILTVRSNGSKDLVGRCMLVPAVSEMISYSGFIIRIRPDGQTANPHFLLYFMKSRPARSRLTSDGGGTGISNINQAKLAALPVFLPPLKQQEEIVNHLDAFSEELKRLASIYERKIAALEELKTSLLHQAFNGEL
jgi:type I restriction enzyme S subunit